VKDDPAREDRFVMELILGVCLLAQQKFDDAKSHLLAGYNGMRPDRDRIPPVEQPDLGWLIEQVDRLRDKTGALLVNTTILSRLHKDPRLQEIVQDLQFPAEVFAPP
jgi:hypothetical protein